MGLKVEKEKYKATIVMNNMRIKGYIHIMPKSRLTDVLNSAQIKDFIPITDAEVEYNGKTIYLNFVEVNKNHIQALYLCEDNVVMQT